MGGAYTLWMQEIEIKFLVRDVKSMNEKLKRLGFKLAVGRHWEKNLLLDDQHESLKNQGKLLRIRKTPSGQSLTFKGPIAASSKLKHRDEIECKCEDAGLMVRILEEIGYKAVTQYSKYRTVFEREGLIVSLDETEAGNYIEVEGLSDDVIMNLGKQLGYTESDYIRRTYAELIAEKKNAEHRR
jgi:adenylate cyclase, class 2